MPRTLGGLIGFVVTAVVSVFIGLWIINRVPALQMLLGGGRQ